MKPLPAEILQLQQKSHYICYRSCFYSINAMDSLFEDKYHSCPPMRKYEPLIRFNLDGQPQPRRILQGKKLEEPPKVCPPPEIRQTEPKKSAHEDLKRKVTEPVSEPEPKRKQQKQQSIMAFFTKKA